MIASSPEPIPAAPYIALASEGHYLIGSRCGGCGATLLGKRIACAACGERDAIATVRLADTGRIRTWTRVHRSYPGVPVPFVAAVISIDGGGVVRGTLRDADVTTKDPAIGAPVRITIEDSGQKNEQGQAFFCHVFSALEAE